MGPALKTYMAISNEKTEISKSKLMSVEGISDTVDEVIASIIILLLLNFNSVMAVLIRGL